MGLSEHFQVIEDIGQVGASYNYLHYLELHLRDFPANVFIGEPQINSRGVDVSVTQLLLKGVEPSTAVEEVDGVTMTK